MIGRWWLQFDAIVWPDKLSMDLAAFLPGEGRQKQVKVHVVSVVGSQAFGPAIMEGCGVGSKIPYCFQVRRQVVRLANLSVVMVLRRLSVGVAKRFPTFQHLVQV